MKKTLTALLLFVVAVAPIGLAATPTHAQVLPEEPTPSPDPTPEPTPDPTPEPTQPPAPATPPPPPPPPAPKPASTIDLAVSATSGMGMYVWRWQRTGTVDQVVAHAKATGMSHLVVRASSQSEGFYLAPILSQLLPKAHAAGLKVVAYDPPRFEDIEADVRRAHALIAFRAGGHAIDAFAADIEPAWDKLTAENMDRYGARLREVAPGFPLVAVVYPPNQVGNRYPFAAAAKHFDVLSPMSYWRARTTDSAGFMADSVRQLAAFGKPVTAIGQAFAFHDHPQERLRAYPSRAEIDASIAAARGAGAVGMSFWVWEHAQQHVFDAIKASAWAGGGRGVGSAPPKPPAPLPAVVAAGSESDPVVEPEPEPVPLSTPRPLTMVLSAGPAAEPARSAGPLALAVLVLSGALLLADRSRPMDLTPVVSRVRSALRTLLSPE